MWGFLIAITALHSIMCLLIYSKHIHDKIWYLPLALLIALINNYLWFYAAKITEGRKDIYIFSAFQTVAITAIYFLIPVLLYNMKLTRNEILGIIAIFLGIILIKAS